MSRTIDADALIKVIERESNVDGAYGYMDTKSIIDVIDDAPTVEPEPKWIPVSERLPKYRDERYLVSLAFGGVGVMELKDTGWHNYGSLSPVPIEVVIAWMPVPESYKEEQ